MKWTDSALTRVIAASIALASAGALSYVVIGRGFGNRAANSGEAAFTPIEQLSKDDNNRLERIMTEISPKTRIKDGDARFLVESMNEASAELSVQRIAIATAGSILGGEAKVSDKVREVLIAGLLDAMSNPNAGSRRSAIASCSDAGLLEHPEIRLKIVSLQSDPNPRVSSIAKRALSG